MASWRATNTASGSATSVTRRRSSRAGRADRLRAPGRPPTASPASVVIPGQVSPAALDRRPDDRSASGTHGNPIGKPLGHDDWVTPVALGRLGDRDVIVSGGSTTVRIWETTGHPVGTRYAPSSRALGSKRVAPFSQLAGAVVLQPIETCKRMRPIRSCGTNRRLSSSRSSPSAH